MVIFGPNGAGKSAVVDAIDFLFTGDISRLSGPGSKDLTLKDHGKHVDLKDIKLAIVRAKVKYNDKDYTIVRSMNKPTVLMVEPKEGEKEIVSYLDKTKTGQHILSRREILKYITLEAGKRAEEVQKLLNVSDVEEMRKTLKSLENDASAQLILANANFNKIKQSIATLLSLTEFSEDTSLVQVNQHRKKLSLPELTSVNYTSKNLKMETGTDEASQSKDVLTVEQIKGYIRDVKTIIAKDKGIEKEVAALLGIFEKLKQDKKIKQYSLYKTLYETGIKLIDSSNICPLCGRTWDKGDFKVFLAEKEQEIELASGDKESISTTATSIKGNVDSLMDDISNLIKAKKQFKITNADEKLLDSFVTKLDSWSKALVAPLKEYEDDKWPSDDLGDLFRNDIINKQLISPLEIELEKAGDLITKQQSAWSVLTKMEVYVEQYETEKKALGISVMLEARAKALYNYFEIARNKIFSGIYEQVKDNFSDYYKAIHDEDEKAFVSDLTHEGAKLNLKVDFYGRGLFPPNALHSEGHQDSMGLCLFFALNKYLGGDEVKVIVLDDVVMSIDRGHRRGICKMLIKYFSDKQFIITTHDTAWAKQLKSEGIIKQKNMLHFMNWSIDSGPIIEIEKDLWDRINEDLNKDDVPSAAHKLRRNAECFFENVCDFLSSNITYRGNHQWDLGDYAPAAISSYKVYIAKAKDNFNTMGQQDKVDRLNILEREANDVISKAQIEQWIINKNVHYDKWDGFTKADFTPIVDAFKKLFDLFYCKSCGNMIMRSENGDKTTVSCGCGDIFWNISK